jgi:hypothetical protein
MMKLDVVAILTLVLLYYHYCLPEEEKCSFGFVKDQMQDEMMMMMMMMMMMIVKVELIILQSLNIFYLTSRVC